MRTTQVFWEIVFNPLDVWSPFYILTITLCIVNVVTLQTQGRPTET